MGNKQSKSDKLTAISTAIASKSTKGVKTVPIGLFVLLIEDYYRGLHDDDNLLRYICAGQFAFAVEKWQNCNTF